MKRYFLFNDLSSLSLTYSTVYFNINIVTTEKIHPAKRDLTHVRNFYGHDQLACSSAQSGKCLNFSPVALRVYNSQGEQQRP